MLKKVKIMSTYYKLEGKKVISCGMEYPKNSTKTIKSTYVGDAHISTIFMCIDYGFNSSNDFNYKPLIFETMVFGSINRIQYKSDDYDEALKQHIHSILNAIFKQNKDYEY